MSIDLCEIRPRRDKRGVDLISHALPFGGLWYDGPNACSDSRFSGSNGFRLLNAPLRMSDHTSTKRLPILQRQQLY
jgi:hypothetical protein